MRILLVDDQSIIREGLSLILGLYDDIKIVGQACNGEEAIEFLIHNEVDVVLMDIRMPVLNGVDAVKEIKSKWASIKVIMLTTFNEDEYIFSALKNGASGYLLKDVKSEKLYEAIKHVYNGNIMLQNEITEKVVQAFTNMYDNERPKTIDGEFDTLTERESEIAYLILEGLSNKEIAEKLYLSIGTVKNYISRILSKLGLRDRTQIALYVNGKR